MPAQVPDGIEAAKLTAAGAEPSDADVLVDCAEFDVGLAWEALHAAQELCDPEPPVRCGRVLLEPSAN